MWNRLQKTTLWVAQCFVVLMVWPYSKIYSMIHAKKKLPPPRNPLLFYSAKTLADMIRNQQVSSYNVVNAYIERIQEVDPIINSFIEERFEQALEEAKDVDIMIKEKPDPNYWRQTKPLLGVPISIKESLAVSGLSHNGGRLIPRERLASEDGTAVSCVRDAGAVILGVTNTPEFCLFWETYNNRHGITRNPYDSRRTAGGSSGGECALLGAAGSVIGLGSDIVGSGRIPALFCGTFGHKPTPRIISVDGHLPVSEDPDWNAFLVVSPLCRYAEDLPLLMSVAAPTASKILRLDQEVDLKKIRVFYMEEHTSILNHSVDPEMRLAIKRAADHFKTYYNAEIKKIDFCELCETLEAASTMMLRMRSPQTIVQKSDDTEDWTIWDALRELCKKLLGISQHNLYAICFAILKRLADLQSNFRMEQIQQMKLSWLIKLQELLGDDGVLIMPTFPHNACLHFQMYYKLTNVSYLSMFNFLELPATAVPMGLSKRGIPIGIQVGAWRNQDRLTFAVAKELETAFGGWVPPSTNTDASNANNNQTNNPNNNQEII